MELFFLCFTTETERGVTREGESKRACVMTQGGGAREGGRERRDCGREGIKMLVI